MSTQGASSWLDASVDREAPGPAVRKDCIGRGMPGALRRHDRVLAPQSNS